MANVQVFSDKQMDKRTDGQTDEPKIICPRSIDKRASKFNPCPIVKAFAEDNLNKAEMVQWYNFPLDRIEKTVGKGESASYQHFLHSHSIFKT